MKKALSILLTIVMLVAGTVLPVQAEDFVFESDHPYESYEKSFYVYEYETEKDGFVVTFNEKTSVTPVGWLTPPQPDWTIEDVYENYVEGDIIAIYQNYEELSYAHLVDDEEALMEFLEENYYSGDYDVRDSDRMVLYRYNTVDYYTGAELAGQTLYISGDYLAIEIESNSSVTDYGFAVDYIGEDIPEGMKYVHYNIGEYSYYDFFTGEEGLFVNSKWIYYVDYMPNHLIGGWATEPDGEIVYDAIGHIEDGKTDTNFISYSGESLELYPVFERNFYSVNYEIDNNVRYESFTKYEDMYVSDYFQIYFDPVLFKGWSEDKDATEPDYLPGDLLPEKRDYVLYPVLVKLNTPLIDIDDCWNFDNYSGEAMDVEAKYEMMLRNAVTTWGISPALWGPAALYTSYIAKEYKEETGGHCFGMALTVILNHYGYIDLLEGREEECVADLPHDEQTDAVIHYYHTIQTQGVLVDQVATENNTDIYRQQVENMCESIKAGNVVQLSPSWNNLNMTDVKENTIDFGGHSMALLAVTDIDPIHIYPWVENEENEDLTDEGVVCDKIITLYDSNHPGEYQYIYVAEDYSYLIYEGAVYGAIRWGDDFSHFESFDINGNSNPFSWHIAFIRNILRAIKTAFQIIFRGTAA